MRATDGLNSVKTQREKEDDMRETYKKQQGYEYYVYVCPGVIEYFFDYDSAKEYAEKNNSEVKEMF